MANPNRSRYIKTVSFNSINDVPNIDKNVNEMVDKIRAAGGAIISIVPHNFGVNPINLIFIIIYEAEHNLESDLK